MGFLRVRSMSKLRTIIFLLIAHILLFSVFSTDGNSDGDAGQPGEFLRYGVNMRSMGLGGAYISLVDDASAMYYNPAGLMRIHRKYEFFGTYTYKHFNSTNYGFGAFAFPRVLKLSGPASIILGREMSFGVSLVQLRSGDFEHRNEFDDLLGNFSIRQGALLLSSAGEHCGSFGVFDYGMNLKYFYQDLMASNDGGFGMDLGFQIQFINPPLIHPRLKYLLPLRIGAFYQNIIAPKFGTNSAGKDDFPSVFKLGLSYGLMMRDDQRLTVVADRELFLESARSSRWYLGSEYQKKHPANLKSAFRIGYNGRIDKLTAGAGLGYSPGWADIRIDCAFVHQKYLKDDLRFSLTLDFNRLLDHDYFFRRAIEIKNTEEQSRPAERKPDLLQVISRYPNDSIDAAALLLAVEYDTRNAGRYFELMGNLPHANWLLKGAKIAQQEGDTLKAQTKAGEAVRKYQDETDTTLQDGDRLNFVEAYMLTDSSAYPNKWDSAAAVLQRVKDKTTLPYHYLGGISYKSQGDWDLAIEQFWEVIKTNRDSISMRQLSLFNLAHSLIKKYEGITDINRSAIKGMKDSLNAMIADLRAPLDKEYPRYPIFQDSDLADDAQYMIGRCHEVLGEKEDALKAYAKVNMFYPGSDSVNKAEQKVRELLHEDNL